MNSNELNNYINSLNEFSSNELKVKLENFYLFNKPVISFFKGIDSQFHSLMSANSIDEHTINSIVSNKEILDALTNAKRELFSFDEIILSESVKNKLLKNYDYIVNTMVLNEALTMIQKIYTLLSENELALKSEQEELENLKKKKIEDDRKKKEEEKRKEELRLAEIEVKNQEEKRKLKELEEKRRQEELRINQEKEKVEKERVENLKRKELEENRKGELRLAEIELKNQEEKRKLKELEEKRRQEELRINQEKERTEKEKVENLKRKELEENRKEERLLYLENYLVNNFINDLLNILNYNYPYGNYIKFNYKIGDEYKFSIRNYNPNSPVYTTLVYFDISIISNNNNVFNNLIELNAVKRQYFCSSQKKLFSDTKYIISNYNDIKISKILDPLTFFDNRNSIDTEISTGCSDLNWRPSAGLKDYGSIPNWLEIRENFDFFMDGKSWGFKRK